MKVSETNQIEYLIINLNKEEYRFFFEKFENNYPNINCVTIHDLGDIGWELIQVDNNLAYLKRIKRK